MIESFQPQFILEKEQKGKRIFLQEAHDESLDRWIAERHYLQSTPPGARLRLWIMDKDRNPIGAMMWGRPASRELDPEQILELTRMYFIEETEAFVESRALALARKYIRKHLPKVKLVLAYASSGRGHDGTIYKADNWARFGRTSGGKWSHGGERTHKNRADRDTSKKIRWVRSP